MKSRLCTSARISTLAALLLGGLVAAPNANAARWTVDIIPDDPIFGSGICLGTPDFHSIQAAIDSEMVSPGDTIFVCPDLYFENVSVTKSLILKGAQAGRSGIERPVNDVATEASTLGSFTIKAPQVVIDGFTVTLGVMPGSIAITVKTPGNRSVITNNVIDVAGGGPQANPDLPGTILPGNAIGIYLEYGPDKVRVTRNRIQNLTSDLSAQGILVGDSTSADPSLNILVSDNLIQNIRSLSSGAYGVQVNNGAKPDPATGFTTITVRNNTIQHLLGSGPTGWAHAIGLEGPTPDAQVTTNEITDVVGSVLPDTSQNAISVFFEDNPYFPGAQTHLNNFDVTKMVAYGIAVNPGLTSGNVPGTCNWWNSRNGPTTPSNPGGDGAKVSPNVRFDPWLTAPAPHGPCKDNNNECIGDDDDDFDHDGKRDDVDADDDNDGKADLNDDDDDNDGQWDANDDDDDNDCINDEDDDKSTRQHERKGDGNLNGGGYNDSIVAGDDSGLPLVVRIESPNAQFLKIEIYDPAGRLLSVSLPTPGKIFAIAPANLLGLYKVRVRNAGVAPITYTSKIITSSLW